MKGPEGASETLFIDRGDEGRYAFAMNVDFFATEGMRTRGPHTSCGIISLACLNLPVDIRYKPENMYLAGVIPGPSEPSKTELNHYIRPLVDDMSTSWTRGIRYTRTSNFPDGKLTRSAIVVAVCDLPAACKVSQLLASTSHHFCSCCECHDKAEINRTDYQNWKPRCPQALRSEAESWRDASTSSVRNQIEKEHGVRWSELWRLPYWEPTRMLVTEVMHAIYERAARGWLVDILHLTSEGVAIPKHLTGPAYSYSFSVPSDDTSLTERDVKQVRAVHRILTRPILEDPTSSPSRIADAMSSSLNAINKPALTFVCRDLKILSASGSASTKANLQSALLAWVCVISQSLLFISLILSLRD